MKYKNDIDRCIATLEIGGLILYPTDTIWGIGCDPLNEDAVNSIYKLKQRTESKSMIILVADEDQILKYTDSGLIHIYDYIKGVHKPTTVIYPKAKNLAKNLINSDGSIAIRVVKNEFCKMLIQQFGRPLVSTSANVSGYPAPGNFKDVDVLIRNGVDYIVEHRQDDEEIAAPSTIVKIKEDGSIEVIRP
jgi:L-threonylcarbamoyladenylate synthase